MSRHLRLAVLLTLCGIVLAAVVLARMVMRVSTLMVPAEGGTYTEGMVGAPQWLNPVLAPFNEMDQDLCRLLFRGLTRVDEHARIVPDLAESWQVSGDGLAYTFTLRPGLEWQDGASVTADDAAYTFRLMQSTNFPGPPYLADLWKRVQVEKVDARQVRFTLEEPFAPFLDYTTTGLLPAHILGDVGAAALLQHPFNTAPVGNGPFMLERMTAEEVILRPNPRHEGLRPYLEKLVLRFYTDTPSVLAAYREGEVDGIRLVPPEYQDEAAALADLSLYTAPMAEAAWLLLNTKSSPLDDAVVRRALSLATDRQQLIEQTLHGQALPLYGPLLPDSWAYNPAVAEGGYDPDAARELLKKAGWADADGDGVLDKNGQPLAVEIAALDSPASATVADGIAAQWKQAGVAASVSLVAQGELASVRLRPRDFQAVLYYWLDITPDPDLYPFFHSTQTADPGQNFAQYANRDADEIMEEARRTVDAVRRHELYARLQEILRDEAPVVFLYQPIYTMGVREEVKGVTLGPVHSPADRFGSIAGWYVHTRRMVASQAAAPQ
jgi:peptide/nickel transport system substrate-binding protein